MIQRSLLALLLVLPAAAHARPGNDAREHDAGAFFMRLSAGFGFGSAAFDDSEETTRSGLAGMGSFAFGGTVGRNIALHADLFGLSLFEPTLSKNGEDLGDLDSTVVRLGALGLGATFYVMPANLYIGGSIGVGVGSIEARARAGGLSISFQEDTDPGLAVNLMLGKEWWVARKWGLGVALQGVFAALETDAGEGLAVFGVGVLFSATMN